MSLRGRPLCDDKSGEHHGVWGGGGVDKLTNRNLFCDFRDVGSLEASAEILGSSSSLGTLSAGDDDLEIGMRLFCLLLCRHRLRDMMGQRDCCMQSVIGQDQTNRQQPARQAICERWWWRTIRST